MLDQNKASLQHQKIARLSDFLELGVYRAITIISRRVTRKLLKNLTYCSSVQGAGIAPNCHTLLGPVHARNAVMILCN